MKIRSPGLVQGYNLAIYNRVGGKIPECLNDLWESFVEVLVIPGRDKREMPRMLAEFVKANLPGPTETLNFGSLKLPEGFGSMSIWQESRDWRCGEGGSYSVSDIREALTSSITAKNRLVPTYRKNLAPGAQVWLLPYSTFAVSRGMEIPYGIEQWRFNFGFDRVFWFTTLGTNSWRFNEQKRRKQQLSCERFGLSANRLPP